MFLEECHWFNGPYNEPGTDLESGEEVDLEEINQEVESLKQEMEKAGNKLLSHHTPPRAGTSLVRTFVNKNVN